MPRIDPLQLLDCLNVLLSHTTGGILSKNEVHRCASLMTKFSKKLVSKCVYVLILKNTDVNLLGLFMAAGGWTLIHLWLNDAVFSYNWALLKELLELLLITPVDVERLKSNNIPKLVKSLSKREDLPGIHDLSNQLVQLWLRIVKDETQGEASNHRNQPEVVPEELPRDNEDQPELADDEHAVEEVTENEECDTSISSQTFYKLTLKDGKHLISKVGATDTNFQILENVEVVEMKDDEEVKDKDKEKKEEKKKAHDKSKHKSSSKSNSNSSSSNNRDKEKSSHRDKSKHSSSSKDRDKDKSRDKSKHDKSKDKDRHRSNGSISKSSSNTSSSKDKEKKDSKEKQAEKDKDTLSKIQPSALQKLPKIPKKSHDEKDKLKESKKDDSKRGSISVEVRKNNEERPKTVKVYKSKMRSTGLEEEAKPAPPRPSKKPGSAPIVPTPPVPSLKRPSPIRDLNVVPPEKKTKIEPPVERPGSIKLIPPKPKPAVLQESDMFMDALTASATTKKEPKKRKRRASVSKDSSGTSPPSSPSPKEAVTSLKNLSPPKFYQDTLETEEVKQLENSESPKITNDNEINLKENDTPMEVTSRVPTPIEATAEEEPPRTKVENGLKGVLVYGKRKGPKKSIKWKSDEELVDIQYFELDETERVNVTKTFGDLAKMDVISEREALQMSRKLQNKDVMDVHTEWRIPFEIDLPEPLAEPGSKSLEKDIQFAREKSVLQDLYFNKKILLETPAEPDPEMFQVKDPIVIPVDAADNPDHDFRDTPWPEPKGSPPPPPNVQSNVNALFPNVQGPFNNFPLAVAPNFQNMQNMQNVQSFQGPPQFMQQNILGGTEWNNVNMPNMHNPQIMPRNIPPPEMINQGLLNPNIFIPPQENFNPMVNDNNHRFPVPFNQQGPGMFQNNFNRGGFRRGGGGGGNGPWLRMNSPSHGNWNMRNGGGPHRGGGRVCHHFRNKGFCKNGDNCPFLHPNN